jgi:hypothetical protein
MKKGKELKVTDFKNYNIVYGSVNNKDPRAMYVNISAWAEPKVDCEINYNRIIRNIDKNIRQTIYNLIDCGDVTPFFKDKTIVDFDIKKSGVRYGKRSFANCEITLYLKDELSVNSEYIKPIIKSLIKNSISCAFDVNEFFNFYKTKK